MVTEADNLVSQTDPDASKFMDQRNDMLRNINASESDEDKNKVQLQPMGPFAASSTVVNLLLATGPFA